MADRPIPFRPDMVRAILDGRKTQTRRLFDVARWGQPSTYKERVLIQDKDGVYRDAAKFARYAPGDRLWVRETWCLTRDTLDYETGGEASSFDWDEETYGDPRQHLNGDARFGTCAALHYPADGEDSTPSEMWPCIGVNGRVLMPKEIRWRSSRFMPRWASRLTLTVTEVRVERLQDITEDDARAEGVEPADSSEAEALGRALGIGYLPNKTAFCALWNSIYGPGGWHANQWVVAVTFTVGRHNIDAGNGAAP